MDEMKSITLDDVSAAQKHFAADRANLVAKNAATAALFWWILPWGFALFNPRKQFLYDWLAGTELIDLRQVGE